MWPENWPAFLLFSRLQTQWRTGMNGRTGIDYCAAYPLLDRMNLSGRDWDDALDDLRVMEIAAIAEMNKD